MKLISSEFSEQQKYYCGHIDSFLKSYKASISEEDSGGVLGQTSFVSNLAEITLGYVDSIIHADVAKHSIDDLLPNHHQLLDCFVQVSDAILREDPTIVGVKNKAIIDRARYALLDLSKR